LRVGVIGAGPSGLALARLLADRGYSVHVYEAHERLAVKPCGWGYPELDGDERSYSVFIEGVRASIWGYRGYRVYLDDGEVYNRTGKLLGYIVDKREFLERLSQGLEVERGSSARYLGKGVIRGRRGEVRYDAVVVAGGFPAQPKKLERILAIQAIVRSPSIEEPEIPELRFYSELVGYAWVFPESEKVARVGVGGYAERPELERLLQGILKKRSDLSAGEILKIEGAEVTVSGVDWDLASSKDPYYVGEALGFVMPATGEGIRPAIWSSIALSTSIDRGKDYAGELRKLRITKAMRIHKRVLDLMMRMNPKERAWFLKSIPEDLMLNISLGRVDAMDLLGLAGSPKILALLARYSINIL